MHLGDIELNKWILSLLLSFFIAMLIAPVVIYLIKKMHARQTILFYVTQHKQKEGIPTMGGLIFIISTIIASFVMWSGQYKLALVALVIMLSYGIIGFLDDFIKIVLKRNLGLKVYQKIVSQLAIAILASIFAYKNMYIGSAINIPLINTTLQLNWWFIPFCIFIFIATTNSVNLTDGLDGLAGSTTAIYLATFFVITFITYNSNVNLGNTFYAQELNNLLIFMAALIGGIIGFLWHNSCQASVFMGDTGSLALGGACVSVAIFTKNPLIILIVGIMFVVSSISVIIQVLHFKRTKQRVFLMSPYHHHLEMKGYKESKIVAFYSIITAIMGLVAILIY